MKAALRTSVNLPMGAAASPPKQRQFGLRPRKRLILIAIVKPTSSTSVMAAPHQAKIANISATAAANSAVGIAKTSAAERTDGMPNSRSVRRNPSLSASFDRLAAMKIAARKSRAISSAVCIVASLFLGSPRDYNQANCLCLFAANRPADGRVTASELRVVALTWGPLREHLVI